MKNYSRQYSVKENTFSLYISNCLMQIQVIMFFSILTFFCIMTLNGCSGGGGEGIPVGGASGSSTDQDPYAGSAKVAGTIKLSALTSSDSAQLSSNTGKKMARARTKAGDVDPSKEAVKLFVVGEDGSLEDTGISCSLTGEGVDRSYECNDIKDGVNYIVRYIQMTESGDALELKANAFVPDGAFRPSEDIEVTPQTSVITEALVAAILSATSGAEIDDTIVNEIIESVKTAIETLVKSGSIQIPSMVVNVEDGSDLEDIIGGETKNEKLDSAAGLVLTDNTVDTELGFITSETEAALFNMSIIATPAEKEAFIRKVFSDLLTDDKGESDDMPEIFYSFFTWLYVNNQTVSAGGLLDTLLDPNNIIYDPAAINTGDVSTADLLSDLNIDLNRMYTLLDIAPSSLTLAQKEELADFPAIFRGLFPESILPVTTTTALNPPQSIAVVLYMEDVYMPNTVEPTGDLSGSSDDGGQVDYKDDDVYEWDDESLFDYLGIQDYIDTHPSLFTGVDISRLNLRPGTVHINNTEQEALMCSTDIMDLAAFASGGDENLTDTSGAIVTLTYPKRTGGTGTIDLIFISRPGEDYSYWGIDPWSEAEMNMPSGSTDPVVIDPARVFSDFTSGTYIVTVTYGGATTNKSFEKKVITGMTDKYVKITTPRGMPIWPGENATTAEKEAFETSQQLFYANGGRTNFTANVMSNGLVPSFNEPATHAKITVSWEAPEVTLPEGVKMVYDIDIGQSNCSADGSNCDWTPIWNTWDENKRIYSTSVTIPYIFPIQPDTTNPFHLNIGVNFVNQTTGEYLGRGGKAHTEFTVGQPLDLTKSFNIRGLNSITVTDTNVTPSDLRIALIKEVYNSTTSTSTRTIVRIADLIGENRDGYSLNVFIGDLLSGTTMNTWFNLILIEDATDTLSAGSSFGFEPTYWPNSSSGNMWFDTWGGMLKISRDTCTSTGECVHEETVITGDEVIDGPEFYIGQETYIPPDPTDVTPVAAGDLSLSFTIVGNVETTIGTPLTNPQVILLEEEYDDTLDSHVQKIISIDPDVSGGTYSLSTTVGAFYDNAGLPITDKHFQIVLVDAIDNMTGAPLSPPLAVGDIIGFIPMWWPDWSAGNFGFDTWRGGALWIYNESVSADVWTRQEFEVGNPDVTFTGPYLRNVAYSGSVQ